MIYNTSNNWNDMEISLLVIGLLIAFFMMPIAFYAL